MSVCMNSLKAERVEYLALYSSEKIFLFFLRKGRTALTITRKVMASNVMDIELLKKMDKLPLDSVRDIRKFSSNNGPRT